MLDQPIASATTRQDASPGKQAYPSTPFDTFPPFPPMQPVPGFSGLPMVAPPRATHPAFPSFFPGLYGAGYQMPMFQPPFYPFPGMPLGCATTPAPVPAPKAYCFQAPTNPQEQLGLFAFQSVGVQPEATPSFSQAPGQASSEDPFAFNMQPDAAANQQYGQYAPEQVSQQLPVQQWAIPTFPEATTSFEQVPEEVYQQLPVQQWAIPTLPEATTSLEQVSEDVSQQLSIQQWTLPSPPGTTTSLQQTPEQVSQQLPIQQWSTPTLPEATTSFQQAPEQVSRQLPVQKWSIPTLPKATTSFQQAPKQLSSDGPFVFEFALHPDPINREDTQNNVASDAAPAAPITFLPMPSPSDTTEHIVTSENDPAERRRTDSDGNERYRCEPCGKWVLVRRRRHHNKRHLPDEGQYVCYIGELLGTRCKPLSRKDALKRHIPKKHPEYQDLLDVRKLNLLRPRRRNEHVDLEELRIWMRFIES